MEHLLQWLLFSDREVGIFQFIFREYLNENLDHLTPTEAYDLALTGNDTQYQMRILKSRIGGEALVEEQIESNDAWIRVLLKFNGLTEFVFNKFVAKFNNQTLDKQYIYKQEVAYSYFNLEGDQLIPDPQTVKALNKIIDKNK